MHSVSIAQMRDLDFYAINHYENSLLQMMELAGYKLARFSLELSKRHKIKKPKFLILCGSGNNGGGGLVAAKNLLNWGYSAGIYLQNSSKLKNIPKKQFNILSSAGAEFMYEESFDQDSYGIVLDCLIGYGLKGGLHAKYMTLIDQVNALPGLKISLDIPSGLHGETGKPRPVAVNADYTLTLAAQKHGVTEKVSKDYVGKVYLADIGIPRAAYDDLGIAYPFDGSHSYKNLYF